MIHYCHNGCCSIHTSKYTGTYKLGKNFSKKAGMFIYDPLSQKILLVLSRGHLWGCPKGSIEQNESDINGAIREVAEETGLCINENHISGYRAIIKQTAIYYYVQLSETTVSVQTNNIENDANGITWIKINCLLDLINSEKRKFKINYHTKLLIYKFLNIYIPPTFPYTQYQKRNTQYNQ